MKPKVILVCVLLLAILTACKKDDPQQLTTLQSLYKVYEEGAIDECRLNGVLVYCAGINAYDAGAVIYDTSGKQIGSCNYGWGPVDTICKQLKSCETVYRCNHHITGQPFVDKYGLSK